jgi:hypothetical protein
VSDGSSVLPDSRGDGQSPFDRIRHEDAYGREYWTGRELQPYMGYGTWERFLGVIERAIRAAQNTGTYTDQAFSQIREPVATRGNAPGTKRVNYRFSRHAAYLVALNGDPAKPEVAAAQAYFVVRTREAELGKTTAEEVRQGAIARAKEKMDYRTLRDVIKEESADYEPSSPTTRRFFATVQNRLYLYLTGMTAQEIRSARQLYMWPGREAGKDEPGPKSAVRKVAKNYLTVSELRKLNRIVARLYLRAEDIADDGLHLTLAQWEYLIDMELAMAARARPAAITASGDSRARRAV